MSHPIIEGPVKLLKIVTPGAYWIKCAECKGSDRLPTSLKHKPFPEYYYPHQGNKVFVRDEDGFFYRGTVCGRRKVPNSEFWKSFGVLPETGFWKYVVQLNDTFQVKEFDEQDVFPTYGESSASCPSAHLVCLHHMLPVMPPTAYGKCIKIYTDEHVKFEKTVTNWDHSVGSISYLTETRSKFSFVQSKLINGCVYGELSILPALQSQTGETYSSLSDYLHREKLGAIITFRFDDVVRALMTNPLIEYSDLLPTFDSSGKTSLKPKTPSHLEKPSEPIEPDFTGFKVHPDDVSLHQSLCLGEFYCVNIFFTRTPLKSDVCLRYVCPDGNIVLGTVVSIDLKYSEERDFSFPDNSSKMKYYSSQSEYTTVNEYLEMSRRFINQPSDLDLTVQPESSPPTYNFDELYQNFKATGGIFEERFLPYPDSPAVEELVLQNLEALGVENLRDWQKLCLPTFSSRKNLLLLGTKSTGKLSTSVICALSWISDNRDGSSIHPQVIIFFSDLDRADKTAILCTDLTDFRVIVSTSSIITMKQKELAKKSCDVLITTPSNWGKLVSEGVFDYSRLSHVIFDEFDRLQEHYAEDLVNILDSLELPSRRVHTVVISNSLNEDFIDLINKSALDLPVVCIADALLSSRYHGLTPTVVFVERNDWKRQLENIFEKRGQKRLLLCKDQLEGRAIVDQVSCLTDVFFVHDSLHKDTALRIVKEWDRNCGKLLVCTDGSFEGLDFVMDVDMLISWMTPSRTALSSRFLAFSRSPNFKTSTSSASAYLLCDVNNFEELLLIKGIAKIVIFINGSLEEHLSRESFIAERMKSSPICPSIFMFGSCDGVPSCPFRHVFQQGDVTESLNPALVTQFLKVDILKAHSAFRYSVRVTEVISNFAQKSTRNINALISKLKEIQEGLTKSRLNPCSHSLKIGDMVGAVIDRDGKSILRRVIVKCIPNDISSEYSLSIVDFEEPDIELPLSQLFVISRDIAKHPKDTVDLYISGLMPADFKSDWKNDTQNFVMGVMRQLSHEHSFSAGKVNMVTADRSVLVESINCLREGPFHKMVVSIIDSKFRTLKDLIRESGYCVQNPDHLPSLSKLILKSANPSYDNVVPPSIRFSCHHVVLNHEAKFGFRSDLPSTPVTATVSSFSNPGHFYVQLNEELNKLQDFEKSLSSKLNRSKQNLHLIARDELCAVRYHNVWNRAYILNIAGDMKNSVSIWFVDYGDVLQDVQPNQLYCLPDEFVAQPFFAIQCELVGIKPLQCEKWNPETVDKCRSFVRTRDAAPKTVLVKFCGPKNRDLISKFFDCQMVFMWEPHSPDECINFRLARGGFARFDPVTKHVVQIRVDSSKR